MVGPPQMERPGGGREGGREERGRREGGEEGREGREGAKDRGEGEGCMKLLILSVATGM